LTNIIYKNVSLGRDCIIEPPCIIGKPPRGYSDGELSLIIDNNAVIRPFTTIYAGSVIGKNLQTGQGVSIREDNRIGNNVSIGTNSVLELGNNIGDYSRIHSNCFMELVTLGRYVFVGPNVVFTDDPHPMGCPYYKECKGGPVIEDYAKIGANSTILPGVRIGRNSLIGAGSVVTTDVPPDSVVAGNPAKVIKSIDELQCPAGYFKRPYLWPPYEDMEIQE
jgi:acetyltransferase-like isoleucine patch superfamily enzyme